MTVTGSVETCDPLRILFISDWQIASHVYEGLVGYKKNTAELQSLLALKWEEKENGLRYIFTLRKNIYFHDDPCFENGQGRQLTAQDVIYTFERLARYADECPNWYLLAGKIEGITDFAQGRTNAISGIRILNNNRIEFRLTKSFATFLKILASPITYIIPQEAVEYYGENFAYHPVGTGPFRLVLWKPLQELQLIKHERYWRKGADKSALPKLDALHITLKSDAAAVFSEFISGENYLFCVVNKLTGSLVKTLPQPERYTTIRAPLGLITRFFGFSLQSDSPFAKNPELIKAAALSFDRNQIIDVEQTNLVFPAESMVPPFFLRTNSANWYNYDISAAQDIVKQYQHKKIRAMSNVDGEDVQGLVKGLRSAGFDVELDIQKTNYFQSIQQEQPDLFRVAFAPGFPDPEEYYSLFYSKSSEEVNIFGYKNPTFDELFESALVEHDPEMRRDLFLEMEKVLKNDVPILYISHSKPHDYLIPDFVQGLTFHFLLLDFSEVTLENVDEKSY